MQTLDSIGVAEFIKHVSIKLDQPVMVVGTFGSAKSAVTNQVVSDLDDPEVLDGLLGKRNQSLIPTVSDDGDTLYTKYMGAILCDVRLAQYESVDLRGFPGVNKATGLTVWHAPSTLPFVGNDEWPDDKLIILFLDEITSATPPVFSVAYQLVNERRVGEHVLKPNVRIVCAGNLESDKGVVNRMPMPLCNRLTWVQQIVNHKAWADWAQSVGIAPVVIAFIHFKPNLLMTYDPAKAEKVVATLRTWEKAAAYLVDDMPEDIKWAACAGSIGDGPATELRAFIDIWQKVIPPKQIAADPEGTPVPTEASMRYATAVSISGAMSGKMLAPLYQYLKRLPPEFVVLAWQLAQKRDQRVYNAPEFMDFTKRYRSIFNM